MSDLEQLLDGIPVLTGQGRHVTPLPGGLTNTNYRVRTDGGNGYRVDMRDLDAHAELLDELLACRASVVLSGYASDLYDHTLAEWSRIEIPTGTAQGGTYQTRTEVIWSNRPIGEQPALFDVIQRQLSGGSPETAFKPRTEAVTYRSPTTCTEEEIR